MKKLPIIVCSVLAAWSQAGAAELQLTFNRTGTDASGVSVSASGIDGVSARVTSVSHSLKSLGNAAIVCPDVNGNTNPSINFDIEISGLPAGEKFNKLGLDIHALNSAGGYQQSNDNKNRRWNVTADINSSPFVSYTDIDIAAGVAAGHQVWEATSTDDVTATSPLTLTISVTRGTANEGCFFGLGDITLSYAEGETPDVPDVPDVPENPDAKVYTIKWKNNTASYMTEQADGKIAVGAYSTTAPMFWEFIPTDNENCFYIRNTASGKYIGSCNMQPSSASRVSMSDTPVEYYVGKSAGTGEISGCYWLSSTDCSGHAVENDARALNKDGASSYVITWQNGTARVGSYWTLTESADLYEPRPFTPSAAIGTADAIYHILSDGLSYTADGQWVPVAETAAQRWYFVGTSNAQGGYQIVSAADHTPINSGTSYKVEKNDNGYSFVDSEGNKLELAGKSVFNVSGARSEFALANRIYKMPCGSVGNVYVTRITIGDGFRYPMSTTSNGNLTNPLGTAQKYVILSKDAADLFIGEETPMHIVLNRVPGDHTLTLFVDWDRDGVFEYSQAIECQTKTADATIAVPANAPQGQTRARLRVNANGLDGADDDVSGQVVDLLLNIGSRSAELIAPEVKVNDPHRGKAEWADGTASATAKGTAMFLYWLDGSRILSTDSSVACPAAPRKRTLTAVFSVNLDDEEMDGIDANTVDTASTIVFDGTCVKVTGAPCKAMWLFGVNGNLVARGSSEINVSSLAPGVYIVKAATANGIVSSKIRI